MKNFPKKTVDFCWNRITLRLSGVALTPRGAGGRRSRRRIRMLGALAACLGALATAACDPMTDQYFREGAGSDLYSGQLPQATQLQDAYVYYICRQAGNPNDGTPDGSSCAVSNWTTFTLAGMNDIDQRCDAYLSWLDAQRRDRTPVLTQIAAMGAATGAIMGVAGAGTQALAIVATAFGLASTTYANWNSRLLLDVDHSTVQTLVYMRQQQYRKGNAGVIVPDRAAAIYFLRGYLRICMPITIETDINTSVTLARLGAPQSLLQAPLVRTVAAAPLAPREKVAQNTTRTTGKAFTDLAPLLTEFKKDVDTVENWRKPLRALCASEAQINDVAGNIPSLQHLIRVYQFQLTYLPGDTTLSPEVTGKLTPNQALRLRSISTPCDLTGNAANFFEFRHLPKGLTGQINLLNKALPDEPALDSNASVEAIRARIVKVRNAIQAKSPEKLPFQDPLVVDQFTPDLNASIH
jgi:hypothetical protein